MAWRRYSGASRSEPRRTTRTEPPRVCSGDQKNGTARRAWTASSGRTRVIVTTSGDQHERDVMGFHPVGSPREDRAEDIADQDVGEDVRQYRSPPDGGSIGGVSRSLSSSSASIVPDGGDSSGVNGSSASATNARRCRSNRQPWKNRPATQSPSRSETTYMYWTYHGSRVSERSAVRPTLEAAK